MTDQEKAFYSAICSQPLHSALKKNSKLLKKTALTAVKKHLLSKFIGSVISCEIYSNSSQLFFHTASLMMEIWVELVFDEDNLPLWKIVIQNEFGQVVHTSKPFELFENAFGISFTLTMMKQE